MKDGPEETHALCLVGKCKDQTGLNYCFMGEIRLQSHKFPLNLPSTKEGKRDYEDNWSYRELMKTTAVSDIGIASSNQLKPIKPSSE